nr:SUN domain-containing protein 1 isoform X1 [Camelus dromedarius]XP_031327076.1 SUN domain-containing protein 1 isoform X1 [Camelus dromedarius]XP_031327077.1 SUN domain-containing protein 1 isoform X1 [Camelus dromedarius]XP_031327078.1 SUN domain-containing protein 1 isoform X1 [Camelus dromedarius]XP_031327079.1 SUN domain-containing protein 1 isoform X1 [Camelus dromedarius]XP_031327080.1 SUN domain-containing protein 1 isoform X1 [Camelus dromedarius]XP_031327081.1 SUN domain-containin
MDFSRLHTYAPPQCVPENTGYTYALSSSYSSDALDFEMEHKLDPVFDSPRMSRRSLRLLTTAHATEDSPAADKGARTARQRRSANKPVLSIHHASRKALASATGQGFSSGVRPPVLDESLIREQTQVDHFWGLDDDGDLKGGSKALLQGNGAMAAGPAGAAGSNGYTCSDCSLLSERQASLTACAAARGPSSRIYSRDRNQKRVADIMSEQWGFGVLIVGGASLCVDRILWLAKSSSSSFSSFLVQLFQVVLMKLNYESENYKLKSYESKDPESESHESKGRSRSGRRAHGSLRRSEDGRLRVPGASLCHFLVRTLQGVEAVGLCVSRTVLSALWLAVVAPGKAASEALWWLGIGWYQLVTLVSWLNVFLLTRCLRNICKFLILLIPLLLLLGAGISLRGRGDLLSLLPVLNWTHVYRTQRVDGPSHVLTPDTAHLQQPLEVGDEAFHWHRVNEAERQTASVSGQCHSHDQKLRELTASLQKLQARVDQMDVSAEGLLSLVQSVVGRRLEEAGLSGSKMECVAAHQEHGSRISRLEDVLGELTENSEAIQKELEETTLRTVSGMDEAQRLLALVRHLEQELGRLKSDLTAGLQCTGNSCEKVDAQVRETVRLLFSGDQQDGSLEQLLQKFSSRFVSKDDLQVLLRELELQILRNITHHVSVMKQMPTSEAVVSAVNEAGIPGITEAQARAIVDNALKLYSQDKTGMVDFALESGGGSILSTRCSETYETRTALISLFGIPLWYLSQSPRVVIQPDIYPGNCWAFRGSQGYLVVRLSMRVRPTAFTLEHIPKTLSPTGNITSAPKDFAVYGLESEYQEDGQLLGQFTYDQDGESLQTFPAPKRPEGAFQIVELRIFSNWGHPEYTCLYRFRVHGEPIK